LWVDQHSQQMKNMNWADQYFDGFGRPNRLLITVAGLELPFGVFVAGFIYRTFFEQWGELKGLGPN
jgi:hypothetical protein